MSFEQPKFYTEPPQEDFESSAMEAENNKEDVAETENKAEKPEAWVRLESHEFNPNNFYRIVGEDGYKDFIEKGYLRSSPTGTEPKMVGSIDVGSRPTSFPSFSMGAPDKNYFKKDAASYIFETDVKLFSPGDMNPVTGKVIGKGDRDGGGRHWGYRAIDGKTGEVIKEMSADMIINIYKVDKDGNLYLKKDLPTSDNIAEEK